MNIAVIPARGGSKRIPGKNIRKFCEKPMIAWSIKTALRSGCFSKVVVSTDDQETADLAVQYGAEVPFLRPPELADDHVPTLPVIKHAIQWLQDNGITPSNVCCIYPTAPFLSTEALRQGEAALSKDDLDFTLSVTSFSYPPQRALRITESNRIEMYYKEHMFTRSQDLEPIWHDAGQFVWGKVSAWLDEKPILAPNSEGIVLPRYLVHDIDTEEDWTLAELVFRALKSKELRET